MKVKHRLGASLLLASDSKPHYNGHASHIGLVTREVKSAIRLDRHPHDENSSSFLYEAVFCLSLTCLTLLAHPSLINVSGNNPAH